MKKSGMVPTLHIKGESVPEVYWNAVKKVNEEGYDLRTEYDRKENGEFIDPPSKDAKAMIEIKNPFSQPRFSPLSYSEVGKYIAEFLGAKDHLVVPYNELLEKANKGEEFEATQWPYCYHQRLASYPKSDGSTINQLEMITDKLAKNPITRRAVAITGVPEVDLKMKEDQPCLRYIQLRALENEDNELVLNMHSSWRSRDLFKAWGDNVIGITNLQAKLANRLQEKTGKKVNVGPYTEEVGSLHIYGQDYTEKGMDNFFDNFPDVDSFTKRSMDSKMYKDAMIIPQLEELKKEDTWNFTEKSIKIIDNIIEGYKSGKFLP